VGEFRLSARQEAVCTIWYRFRLSSGFIEVFSHIYPTEMRLQFNGSRLAFDTM